MIVHDTIRHVRSFVCCADCCAFLESTEPCQLTTSLSPDLKVPAETIYSTIAQQVDEKETKYLDYASRPLKVGEFVHLILEEYAHFYLIEQTRFRTGTANRLDTMGNVVEGNVTITDEVMEVSNVWVAVGVEPGSRMNYCQLLHEDDLQKVLENPLAEVPFFPDGI